MREQFNKEMDDVAQLIIRCTKAVHTWIFIGFDADGRPCTLSNIDADAAALHRLLVELGRRGEAAIEAINEFDPTKDN